MKREMEEKETSGKFKVSASFKVGAIALAFMILGYQVALFVRQAAVSRIVADRDSPDTVFVYVPSEQHEAHASLHSGQKGVSVRKDSEHSREAQKIYRANAPRRYESFPFNPNTATIDELMRLGLSEKQAASIETYRKKGGRFRRKADFAKSYVVSDSLYRRLEAFIEIPKLDINRADSAAFDALPGIGPYFASKMVWYRGRLHGYSFPEQLMEIWKLDSARFAAFADLIEVGPCDPYPLWTLPEDSLAMHPYISRETAHGIVIFRSSMPRAQWSVEALSAAGIFPRSDAERFFSCRISEP